jgi:3-phosphoshikimate 1-carboxyvinyltransferase
MNVIVKPSALTGKLRVIPSKSDAHRKLICAAVSDAPTRLEMSGSCGDIDATISCLIALGAEISREGGEVKVCPIKDRKTAVLDCGESGSTFRFLLPVAAAVCSKATFIGRGRLPQRPIGHLADVMRSHGVSFSADSLPFDIEGRLTSGLYSLPGNVSSQYITGLMMALPLLYGDSEIRLNTPLESRGYVDMTVSALWDFGVRVKPCENGWNVPGNQTFVSPKTLRVEGDWSNAAFFLAAGALKKSVTVCGLDMNSEQGDKAIVDILSEFGAEVSVCGSEVTVSHAPLHGCTVDVSDIPDLLPILSVVASFARGKTRFIGASRLRLKESDRLASVSQMLNALGGAAEEEPDALIVKGKPLTDGCVDGCGDHRIVMSAAIAALCCSGAVTITGAEAVNKSYPDFFDHCKALGGDVNVL